MKIPAKTISAVPSGTGAAQEDTKLTVTWPIALEAQEMLKRLLLVSNGNSGFIRAGGPERSKQLADFAHVREFLTLPSRNPVQLLVPTSNGRCASTGLQIYTPFTCRGRLLKSFLRFLAKTGRLGYVPGKITIASKKPIPLELFVTEITGETHPVFAFSLGLPGPSRKLTVQVMRADGEILGYIKLPHSGEAAGQVRHEAAVLQHLAGFASLRPHIPKVLHAGAWEDTYLLFQTAAPAGRAEIEFGSPHEDFLQRLWNVYRCERPGRELVEDAAAYWRKPNVKISAAWRELAQRALERATENIGGEMIPCGISHGDFAPWNTRISDGRLFLFDWESAAWNKPVLWDVFHFHIQAAIAQSRRIAWPARLVRTPLEKFSLLLYLISWVRRLFEEQSQELPEIEYRKRFAMQELAQLAALE